MIIAEDKFLNLINEVTPPKDFHVDNLNRDFTYIFELISPKNQIVVKYPETKLIHLGTRNNITGQELELDIGFEKPKSYPLKSLEDCIFAAKVLNNGNTGLEGLHEGFVVVDSNYHRVKVKTPEYLEIHYLRGNQHITEEDLLGVVHMGEQQEFLSYRPEFKDDIAKIEASYNALLEDIVDYCLEKQKLFETEYGFDRKRFALDVKDHPYAAFAFNFTFKDMPVKDSIDKMLRINEKISKLIHLRENMIENEEEYDNCEEYSKSILETTQTAQKNINVDKLPPHTRDFSH